MKRRHILLFIIAALLVPSLALALPRPDAKQVAPESQVPFAGGKADGSIDLQATDSVGIQSPILTSGRSYTFEVRGTWKPSGATANLADTAFETNGSSWNKTGKGLVLGSTNLGSTTASTPAYRPDHFYSIKWTGRGISESLRINDSSGYGDNSGSLNIKLFQLARVEYVYELSQPVTLGVPATNPVVVSTGSVATGTTVPNQTLVGPQVVGWPVPLSGGMRFYAVRDSSCPNGFNKVGVSLTVESFTTGGQSLPGCYPVEETNYDGNMSTPAEVWRTDPVSLCYPSDAAQCSFGIPAIEFTVPLTGTAPIDVLPTGSSIDLVLTWKADTTKLWRTLVNDGSGTTEWVAPFNLLKASDYSWFAGETAAGGLALAYDVTIYGPNRRPMATSVGLTQPIPGFGQVFESILSSKVNGQ